MLSEPEIPIFIMNRCTD